MHKAAQYGHLTVVDALQMLTVVDALLKAGADVHAVDKVCAYVS